MKKDQLFSSLITSGVVLVLLLALVSIFLSTPSVSVFGALGRLLIGIYTTGKLIIAMILGIAACLLVFLVAWFGAVYLNSRENARVMFDQFRERVSELVKPVCGTLGAKISSDRLVDRIAGRKIDSLQAANEETVKRVRDDFKQEITGLRRELDQARKTIEELRSTVG